MEKGSGDWTEFLACKKISGLKEQHKQMIW